MNALDRLIPAPRLHEVHHVELGVPAQRAWEASRAVDLQGSRVARLLFALRTLTSRRGTQAGTPAVHVDALVSTPERPGFQVLVDEPPRQFAVGAIGKVWRLDIPFRHVADAEQYAAFREPGFVKVAWAIRVEPLGTEDSRVVFELRVDATDAESWKRFRRYFLLIGPFSRVLRRTLLASLSRRLGTIAAAEKVRRLPGDEQLADARGSLTHGITVRATPEQVWPWLVQMGCHRAGFYSVDVLDNAGVRSARELHPEWQQLSVGDVIAATPRGDDGFEVLRLDRPHALVLGGLYDAATGRQLPFDSPRPRDYWHVTWALVLRALDATTTRITTRGRGAFPGSALLHVLWVRPAHHLMESTQLRRLARRVEGRIRRDDWRDVLLGAWGAARMAAQLLTPFRRARRERWGAAPADLEQTFPGDALVEHPRWSWHHAIEIDATPEEVWPWLAQLGVGRGGFYSYQWLENLIGCEVRNAEVVHPEWELKPGDGLRLHPSFPPMQLSALERGRYFVARVAADEQARHQGRPWIEASWLLMVEPHGDGRSRVVSRYRAASSEDLKTRLRFGPTLVEPISFEMDRRMLRELKRRVERARPHPLPSFRGLGAGLLLPS